MKKIITLFTILMAFIAISAQSLKPVMSFDEAIHDFGTVKEDGGSVQHTFNFRNTGTQPLVIHNVRASCGCTTPEWTKMPIPPGGSGFIKATFNPINRPGNFNKTVTVSSNAEKASLVLRITGNVSPKARTIEDDYPRALGPIRLKSSHIAFTKVAPKATKKSQLQIVNVSDKEVRIDFDRIPNHIKIEVEGGNILQPNQKAVIKATFDASKVNDWGYVSGRVNLIFDGKKDYKNRLSVSATIEEDFSKYSAEQLANAPVAKFDNAVFNFNEIKQGDKVTHKFILTNNGKSKLEIRKVKASCGCTAVTPAKRVLTPGESTEIEAVFNSAGKTGRQNKSVTVVTNDPKSVTTLLRITGNVIVD